ncbi:TonB-dependent receptor [Spirosoma utsteinense]|uniref:TonB-dependent receptor n=1 Tax=Spirosoma utsteinense TaxID=2585773 RepID=UPI001EB8A6B7|nr:TonB-dependent receptor [Spirosoma utsteinense]MBC3788936.1 hypothetical protein [Spirosoma utsteinense]
MITLLRVCSFLLISALMATPALAQLNYSLSGTVRDSASRQPLGRMAVVIDYEKATTGTYTDEQGRFTISLPSGRHIVVVRGVGYVPFRTSLYLRQHTTLNVDLPAVSAQLEEVVVTSKGYDRTVREPLLGVSRISMKTLERLPAALGEVDILRGLQLLPGVTSVGEAANGINIRGGTTDQNLILMDDTPIFNPTHMFGLFSVFPPDAVNGLDLYKGNVPARFGGRAASVLDISLKNPNLEQFRLTGGISLVSNKLTADMPLIKGKLGLLVSARGAFNSPLLHLASPRLNDIKADFGDVVAKLFWRAGERSTVTAMGYFSKDFFQTNLLGSLANINATGTRYRHQTLNGMVRWFSTLTPRLNVQTTAIVAQYVPDIISLEAGSANKVTLRQGLLQRQIKSNLNYQTEQSKTEVGISATHYRLNPGELLPGQSLSVNGQKTPIENALETALYADHEVSVSDRLAISAGLRYSYFMNLGPSLVYRYAEGSAPDATTVVDSTRYGAGAVSQTYGGFEPRLGIRYAITPTASVKLGYNLMRQYLQVITNTTTPLPTARWKTADAHIRPQVSQLLSAGWFQNLGDNIYEVTAEVYWRTTQHVLDYKPGANFLLQATPETQLLAGRSKAYGLELMASKKKGRTDGLGQLHLRPHVQPGGRRDRVHPADQRG